MLDEPTIRTARWADAEDIARIHVDTWRYVYKGLLPDKYLENLSYERITQEARESLSDPQTDCFVAEGRSGAIGYGCGGPERSGNPIYQSEIYELYILPRYHLQGLGTILVKELAKRLHERSFYTMMVWVLAANPSRHFYEKVGALYLGTRHIVFAGRDVDTDAYGWIDISLAVDP